MDSSATNPPAPWRNRHLRRDLFICTTDGAAYTVMVGIAELYFAAFVLRLGLGGIAAGLIATVPMLLGAALQTMAPPVLIRLGSYRRFVSLTAYVQAAAILPLVLIAFVAPYFLPSLRDAGLTWIVTAFVFLTTTVYFAAGLSTAPAWTTLTGALIPSAVRPRYFARRTRQLQFFMIGGIVTHGLVMMLAGRFHPGEKEFRPGELDPILLGFAAVFAVGSAARFISAYYLGRYSEAPGKPHEESRISFREYVGRFRHAEDGKYLSAMLAMHVAAQIAQPYFNPFMIKILGMQQRPMLSESTWMPPAYTWMLAAWYLGRIMILPLAGRIARQAGMSRVLLMGTLALIPLPLFWVLSSNLWALFAGQLLSGMAWACWELGGILLIYEKTNPKERTSIVTHQTLCNEVCKTSGSLLGAGGLQARGDSGYETIFWASTIARVFAAGLLLRVHRDVNEGRTSSGKPAPVIGPSELP